MNAASDYYLLTPAFGRNYHSRFSSVSLEKT